MRPRGKWDPVRAIEACYRAAPSDTAWLSSIVESVRPLDEGRGAYAKTYAPCDAGSALPCDEPSVVGKVAGRDWREIIVQQGPLPDLRSVAEFIMIDPQVFHAVHRPSPSVDLASRRLRSLPREKAEPLVRGLRSAGVEELLIVYGGDPDRRAALLSIVVPSGFRAHARVLRALRCVSAHLNSARRLRLAATGRLTPLDDERTEAILDPSARIQHAAGPARERGAQETLAEAVRRIEWARGPAGRADPERALTLWQGLVEGRWTLVDHCESDGRRFILARRNNPDLPDPKALRPRERDVMAYAVLGHSNKYIGYLLGIAPSAVAKHLASAMAKLAVGSRRELIRAFSFLGWDEAGA